MREVDVLEDRIRAERPAASETDGLQWNADGMGGSGAPSVKGVVGEAGQEKMGPC